MPVSSIVGGSFRQYLGCVRHDDCQNRFHGVHKAAIAKCAEGGKRSSETLRKQVGVGLPCIVGSVLPQTQICKFEELT